MPPFPITKSLRPLLAALLCLAILPATATGMAGVPEAMHLERIAADFERLDERRIQVILHGIGADEDARAKLRGIYRAYLRESSAIRTRQLAHLRRYATSLNTGAIDEFDSASSIAESMSLDAARMDLRRRMIDQASAFLGPRQLLSLFQLEESIDVQIRAGILKQLPDIDPDR